MSNLKINTDTLQDALQTLTDKGYIPKLQEKNIIPSSNSHNIVADEGYDGISAVTINDDKNLVSENIKIGTNILGVEGEYEGNNTHDFEDNFITNGINFTTYINDRIENIGNTAFFDCKNIVSVDFPKCTNIGTSAFINCTSLKSVSFPACTSIGDYAFEYCSSLTNVSFPKCTNIGYCAFSSCSSLANASFPVCTAIASIAFAKCTSLTTVSFPNCTSVNYSAFNNCTALTSVDFPNCTNIGSYAFTSCTSLTSTYFGNSTISKIATIYPQAFSNCTNLTNLTLYYPSVATLSNINAFNSTPISISTLTGSFGSIYVPASLVNAYKSATNWVTYADRITAIPGSTTLINFTINGVSYQAEENMTWDSWINSSYNTGGFLVNEETDSIINSKYLEVLYNGVAFSPSTAIISGTAYTLASSPVPT